jgi:hypothetical protein
MLVRLGGGICNPDDNRNRSKVSGKKDGKKSNEKEKARC